eukprot:3520720-Pyramimonas_sp.AAC.1
MRPQAQPIRPNMFFRRAWERPERDPRWRRVAVRRPKKPPGCPTRTSQYASNIAPRPNAPLMRHDKNMLTLRVPPPTHPETIA